MRRHGGVTTRQQRYWIRVLRSTVRERDVLTTHRLTENVINDALIAVADGPQKHVQLEDVSFGSQRKGTQRLAQDHAST